MSVLGHLRDRDCREIRLSDDGTCELETSRRVIRLHVHQISAVEYHEDDESDREQYTIKYNGGSVVASESIADFEDFLNRLKTLNPGVEVTGFPAGWPSTRALETSARGALFPLVVIAMIVGIAWVTLR